MWVPADAAPQANGYRFDTNTKEIAMTTTADLDTRQLGTDGPFAVWESDHTALVHVLWQAKRNGLTLEADADEIARLITTSRWMAARENKAAS
jgi:hypothetical protein